MKRRVVVTGIGVVSSIGTSVDAFWRSCLEGRSVVEAIPSHWREYSDFKSTIWSPLPPIDYAARGITRPQRMQHDPVAMNTIIAAQEAVAGAEWHAEPGDDGAAPTVGDPHTGIYIGTGIGGAHTFMENHLHPVWAGARKRLEALSRDDTLDAEHRKSLASVLEQIHHPRRINPFMVSMVMPNSIAAGLGIRFSWRGPNHTYCQACASGTVAIGEAFRAIRDGRVDSAVAGGAEYFRDHHGYLFRAFDVSGALVQNCDSPDTANRPFDERRSGFLFGEGASAILTLETLDNATARGAPVLAEITGYAESFDAYSMMAIDPEGQQIEKVLQTAVEDAGLTASAVDYVNAHGTGTATNDEIEARVIERVFGRKPLVNSTKSLVGHTIGASGALEAAVLALSLHHQTTHPNRNLSDPIADLNFVTRPGDYALETGLSQSFAFGGHNAAVVMQRFELE